MNKMTVKLLFGVGSVSAVLAGIVGCSTAKMQCGDGVTTTQYGVTTTQTCTGTVMRPAYKPASAASWPSECRGFELKYEASRAESGNRYLSTTGNAIPSGVTVRTVTTCGYVARDLSGWNEPPCNYGSERYVDYVENKFISVAKEPLSTFGLDVDTASYTTLRRYLTEHKCLPPTDSVRLEEYVNYFNYNYPEPRDGAPVAFDCELAHCPWAKKHQLLRVGVQTKRVPTENLPPANLVFLIDVSGSMSCNGGFDMAKRSLNLLVDQLRDDDYVSIVTYANDIVVRLEPTSGRDKRRIKRVIESLSCGGCTAGGAGLELAYQQAQENFKTNGNNRVILITDGDFNIGISDPDELKSFIAKKRDGGVFLSVFGVGEGNYHDDMMKNLSTAGNGNYTFIDSVLEAKKMMMTEFGGTLFTVAKDVKLQLEFNPGKVAEYRLLGYECRHLEARDFNDDNKDAGEMGAGHTMTALYEIVPVGAVDIDPLKYQKPVELVPSDELLTVKLRYKLPQEDASKLLTMQVVADQVTRKNGPSEDWRFASAVAEFALLVEDSEFKGDASMDALINRAKGAKGKDENGYRAEFIRLAERAQLLME